MKKITVFTTTYNRAYCLHHLYESLLRQNSQDFCWLLIDDGSTDNTESLLENWLAEKKIDIKYVYQENGGMHTGHNTAYRLIETELNVCIDSDDFMPDDGIDRILTLWSKYGNKEYAGLIGLDVTKENKVIGTKFPNGLKDCRYSELKHRYGVTGDKKIIYRTDIVKRIDPYPVFINENFVPLYFPILIDKEYKLLCFNEVFCIVDYQMDGSTLNIFNQYFKNPQGFFHSRKIEMLYLPYKLSKFKSAIHYVSTSIILRKYNFLRKSPKKTYTLFAIPFGIILYVYLLFKKNEKRDISKYTN